MILRIFARTLKAFLWIAVDSLTNATSFGFSVGLCLIKKSNRAKSGSMQLQQFINDFASELEESEGSLAEDTKYKELDAWDSMNMLVIIAMVDRKYNKQLVGEDFNATNTLGDLFNVINSK